MQSIRPMLFGSALVALTAGGIVTMLAETDSAPQPAAGNRVIAWNNLGMHCMDDDFAVFSLLPPFNTIHAQVIRNGALVADPTGVAVTYRGIADANGSINTTSAAKTNFWSHALALFGVNLAPEQGLAGNPMPGAGNDEQAMTWNPAVGAFIAEGIPITPYDDAAKKNFYPMFRVTARAGTQLLATTDIVLPVSDELTCVACHASGAPDAAKPAAGWVFDADWKHDYRRNILRLHDEKNAADPKYATALAALGFSSSGLETTAATQGPVLCAACHLSNALPGSGQPGLKPLTEALHGHHASVHDPVSGQTLDAISNRTSCYQCHPGSTTKCLRGAMGAAVASDGTLEMQCQSCHGNMSKVGTPGRVGWLDEPSCQQCHTGTATKNAGKIRFTSAFDGAGHPHVPADPIFATNAGVPAPGFDLYRFSKGHGGLQCEACHGSTHAEYPSSHASDNAQSIALQGHAGTLSECTGCHAAMPQTVSGGPHGMHPVGAAWVVQHGEVAESEGGKAAALSQCRACHGADDRGTVLSRAFGDRTLATGDFGVKKLWRGFQIGCYACHDGPSSESKNPNHAAVVKDAAVSTDDATPATVALKTTDSDGDALELRIVSQPAHGTVGLAGRQATYFPEPGATGSETFTFAAWDGDIDSNLGTVTVTVASAGCPAHVSPDHVDVDVAGSAGVLALQLPAQCAWTAAVADPTATWLTLTGTVSGDGSALIPFAVAPNAGPSRTANVAVAGTDVAVRQAGTDSADLLGQFKKVTVKPIAGSDKRRVDATLLVANVGAAKAKKSRLELWLSTDPTLDPGDQLLAAADVPSIAPGNSKKLSLDAKVKATAGKFLIARIDAQSAVLEIDESDGVIFHGPLP